MMKNCGNRDRRREKQISTQTKNCKTGADELREVVIHVGGDSHSIFKRDRGDYLLQSLRNNFGGERRRNSIDSYFPVIALCNQWKIIFPVLCSDCNEEGDSVA